MSQETKFSALSKLIDLEEVVNTRTPVWNIGGNGDIRVKLDTDVNDQEWYVLSNAERGEPLEGMVSCWAFPHFNGAYDQYGYEPVNFCFKTFAALLESFHTENVVWAYDIEEHTRRVEMMIGAEEYKRQQEEKARKEAEIDAMPPRTVEMSEREYRQYQDWLLAQQSNDIHPWLDSEEFQAEFGVKPTSPIPPAFRQAFDEQPDPQSQLLDNMKSWGLDQRIFTSRKEVIDFLLRNQRQDDNKPQP